MVYIKRSIDFILFSNLFISLGAVFYTYSTYSENNYRTNYPYLLLVFFSTLFIYNLQRIFYKKEHTSYLSERRVWLNRNQLTIKAIVILSGIGIICSAFFNDLKTIVFLSPLGILSFSYFFPSINLRKHLLLKTLILVFVWIFSSVIIPIAQNDSFFNAHSVLYTVANFCFMAAICVPFDIRDLEIDRKEKVDTIALRLGINNTNRLAILFLFLYFVSIVIGYYLNLYNQSTTIVNTIVFSATLILLLNNNKPHSEYYYTFGIDGLLILKGIGMFLTMIYS